MRLQISKKYTIPIPKALSNWELRFLILSSLLVQMMLIFLAPYRRQVKSKWLRFFTWSLYLLADAIAIYALGNLSSSVGNSSEATDDTGNNSNNNTQSPDSSILVFWAPFLLLHLGGPDTITAFDLEDNELWKRHLITLLVQSVLALYILFLSLPHNPLLAPTLLMFLVGILKYAERNRALYLASTDRFRETLPLHSYIGDARNIAEELRAVEIVIEEERRQSLEHHEHDNMLEAHSVTVKTRQDPTEQKELSELTLVKCGFMFFSHFKGLFLDIVLPINMLKGSKRIMLKLQPEEAFRVIEMELNFLYQVLYTKGAVVHTRWGYLVRSLCSGIILVSFFLFLVSKKHGFTVVEVAMTYTLLGVAISLDVFALTMILVSDQTIVSLKPDARLYSLLTPIILRSRRWSQQYSMIIPQFNLIGFCFSRKATEKGKSPKLRKCTNLVGKLVGMLGFTEMSLGQVSYNETTAKLKLKDFIFNELVAKSKQAVNLQMTKQLYEEKGDKAVKDLLETLLPPRDIEFDECILLLHVATDICFYTCNDTLNNEGSSDQPNLREISKTLSDYMLYLLVKEETMMSVVTGIGMIRYRDTCAEVEDLDLGHSLEEACAKLYPKPISGSDLFNTPATKSVLPDAILLGRILKNMSYEGRWKVIAVTWVKLLSYAAGHINGLSHGKQLSRGGGLLTSVSFLMQHLGLVREYHDVRKFYFG